MTLPSSPFLPPIPSEGGFSKRDCFSSPGDLRLSPSVKHIGTWLVRDKGARGGTACSISQKRSFAQMVSRGWTYTSLNSYPPLFAEPCYSKIITMLIVLVVCTGAAPVCLSWHWARIIPWLHWPHRLHFVIKTESPKGLTKLLLDPEDHWHATLCWWVPGVLLCGQSRCQACAGSRLGRGTGRLSRKPGAATCLGICMTLLCSPPAPWSQSSSSATHHAWQRHCEK